MALNRASSLAVIWLFYREGRGNSIARFIPLAIPITETIQDAIPGEPQKPRLFGRLTLAWLELLKTLNNDLATVEAVQIRRWALADQPTLAAGDSGYLAFVTDYGHLVRWTGTVWELAPGDVGNRFMRFFVGAPQDSAFWQLADGTATTFLTLGGATLTTTAFTTPNVPAGTFIKVLAAFTGLIEAAIAPALSGSTAAEATHTHAAGAVSGSTALGSGVVTGASGADAPAVSGSTAAEAAHTHTGTTGNNDSTIGRTAGADLGPNQPHVHDFTTGAGSSHTHGAGTLAVASHTHGAGTYEMASHLHGAGTLAVAASGAGSSHLHGAGTLVGDTAARPPSLGLLAYFRR